MPFVFCPFFPLVWCCKPIKFFNRFVLAIKEEDTNEFNHVFSSLLPQIYD